LQLTQAFHKLDQMVTTKDWGYFVVHTYMIECASRTSSTSLLWERAAYLDITNLFASISKALNSEWAAYGEEEAYQRLRVIPMALV
jgi:hypothetical protein